MHVGISHALDAADHSPAKFERERLTMPIELDQRGNNQTVRVRDQRTDVRRKLERKHRDRPVREIDAGTTQSRLSIDRTARRDVMAYVRDVNLQRIVAVRQLVDQYGVIEIARRFAVDGHDGQIAEIRAGRCRSRRS